MAERTIRVFEVLYDLADPDGGPGADGMTVYRTRDKHEAERFATGQLCWGSPAKVQVCDAPLRLARRWGLA